MKTLQVVGDSKYGGATYLIVEWCRWLARHGCDVHVLTTDRTTQDRLQGIKGVRVLNRIFIPREVKPVKLLAGVQGLWRLLGQERYDVVHSYSSMPGLLGRIVGKARRVPGVFHHQAGFPMVEFRNPIVRALATWAEGFAVNCSTSSICVSHAVRAQAESLRVGRPDRYVTICNGIDLEAVGAKAGPGDRARLCREFNMPEQVLLVVSTGRLARQKGLDVLLDSVRQMAELVEPRRLAVLVAGDGPQAEELQEQARRLDLGQWVRFLGFRTDIPWLTASADIVVAPSRWEGLSISILEAMALGKPIVASDIAPNAELVQHEVSGLLVPVEQPQPLAQAVARFSQRPDFAQNCGHRARSLANEHYDIHRMFEETWELYVQACSSRRAGQRVS